MGNLEKKRFLQSFVKFLVKYKKSSSSFVKKNSSSTIYFYVFQEVNTYIYIYIYIFPFNFACYFLYFVSFSVV